MTPGDSAYSLYWIWLAALLFGGVVPLVAQAPAARDQAFYGYGTHVGGAGLRIATANGVPEVLVPCGGNGFGAPDNTHWILQRHDPVRQTYDQVFVSPRYPASTPIARTAVGDLLAAGGPEIVIATTNGVVEIWNQATRNLIGTFPTTAAPLTGLAVGDADNDGDDDLVVCSATATVALDVAGTVLWSVPVGGDDVTIAQMDADPANEVAVAGGAVIDTSLQSVQWSFVGGSGVALDAADIDGDGRAELFVAPVNGQLRAIDVDLQQIKWTLPLGTTEGLALANVDGDPALEVVVGNVSLSFGPRIVAYDTVTQQLDAVVAYSGLGVTTIAVGDVDLDGVPEIVFGHGQRSTQSDHWSVADPLTGANEFSSLPLGLGWIGPRLGDVDGDGMGEFVCLAPGTGGDALVVVLDAATLQVEGSATASGSPIGNAVYDLELADVDNDGDVEVFIATGRAYAFDWVGGALQATWFPFLFPSPDFRQIAPADLDGDGNFEVVLASESYLHVFDLGGSVELWRSPSHYPLTELVVGDTDGVPGPEIHAIGGFQSIVYDGRTLTQRPPLPAFVDALHIVASAGVLIGGDGNGGILGLPNFGAGYVPIGPIPLAPSPIQALQWVAPLNFLALGAGQQITLYAGLFPFWRSAAYGPTFGEMIAVDLATARVASAGVPGLEVFDLL
ncbi:MAG: VCBS repeat-containing protein [Planctomycetes bacterium]|nr:VCBS repeat-containing protein [Planctomycetota bacterium]